jgi:hypothetical protein
MLRIAKVVLAASAVALATVAAPPAATAISSYSSSISWTTPATAAIGVANRLTVSIGTTAPDVRVSGGVQFFSTDGTFMGQASTTPSGATGATASIVWVPTQERTYSFTATFRSENPAITGSTTSVPITIQATPNGQWVQIAAPQMYQGFPATLTATVVPSSLQGSVAFSVNEARYGVGPSVPIVNGAATQTFTPTMRGWQQFIVSFTATNSPGTQGAAGQWVNVLPPIGPDDITLSPTLTTMKRYQKAQVLATTISGAPVTLTATGGCTLVGDILTATRPSGTCVVTGTSPDNAGYFGTTESWTIALTPRR